MKTRIVQVGVWRKLSGGHPVLVSCLGPALVPGGWGTSIRLVYVTIEDRLPGEQVSLNFQASTEMLDRFLSILEQDGLKFSRDEIVPGFLIICRVEKDRGGLTVIGGSGGDEPGSGPEVERFCYKNQRECGREFLPALHTGRCCDHIIWPMMAQ